MSFFNGTNNVDPTSKLPNFPPDFIGLVRVDLCKGITSRKGDRAFIAEMTVLESNMPQQVFVGGRYSWYQSLKEPGTAYPSCIAFLYACLGLDPNRDRQKIEAQVKPNQDQWLNSAVNEDPTKGPVNVLKDATVRLQTRQITTKEKKQPFTLHMFSAAAPAPAATAAA